MLKSLSLYSLYNLLNNLRNAKKGFILCNINDNNNNNVGDNNLNDAMTFDF